MSFLKKITPSAVSAILMALAFPPYGLWALCFAALVPFLYFLFTSETRKQAMIVSFFMGVLIIYTGFYWVSDVAVNFGGLPWIVGKLVLVAFSGFHELQFLAFGIAAYYFILLWRRRNWCFGWAFWILPLLYVGFDFLNPKIFPNQIGHGLYPWITLSQLAEWTGVSGITFLMVFVNVFLTLFLLRKKWQIPVKTFVLNGAGFLALFALVLFFGNKRFNEIEAITKNFKREIKISMIQANIGDVDKAASESGDLNAMDYVLKTYEELSIKSRNEFKPDFILWPETAYPLLYTHRKDKRANRIGNARDEWMIDLVKRLNRPLVFGGYYNEGPKDYNSIFYLKPNEELAGMYQKNILLAFGEYVPLGPLAPIVMKFIPLIGDFGRGKGPQLMTVRTATDSFQFTPSICYEAINTEFTRAGARLGADFILNVTNDSWFGDSSEPWIHFLLTKFRSIEHRIPLVRSTNTGFTAIIEPTGIVRDRSSLFARQRIDTVLKLPSVEEKAQIGETVYFKYGEWFAKLAALISLAVVGMLFILNRKKSL